MLFISDAVAVRPAGAHFGYTENGTLPIQA